MDFDYSFVQSFNHSKSIPFQYHIGNTGIQPVYPAHMHGLIEIIWVIEGSGYCKCDGREYSMKPGDIVVVNPYTIHTIYSEETMRFHCFIIEPQFCADNGINISDIHFIEHITGSNLPEIFNNAVSQYNSEKSSPCYETKVKIALLSLLVALREEHTDSVCANQNDFTPALLQTKKAMQYIMSSWQKKITIDDIVGFVNVSPAHLSRNFKHITGKTIVEFINITKCSMAKSFLNNGIAVTKVSGMCGFDNPSYFAKLFKIYSGMSPRDYAKMIKTE